MVITDDTRKDWGAGNARKQTDAGKDRGIAPLKHTHIKGNKMTTSTLNTYYCAFCASIANFANKTFTNILDVTEAIGTARAAAALSQMGHHDLAKELMLSMKGRDNA